MPDQTQILLQTKLHRPRLPHDLLQRTRLIERLSHEIDTPLTLVCAPAGFGKTTLVCSWLEGFAAGRKKLVSRPSAWLSLDANDSDLTLFLRYFIAALRTIFPEACEQTLTLLHARQSIPQSILFATLSNELGELPGEAILVLDDYHTVHSTEVNDLLGELIRHWPAPLKLVLVSRLSPPLPLDRLRARGLISEYRTRDLRFTPEETAAYLRLAHFDHLVDHALPVLEGRFEGWAAGLHLATLSLHSGGSQEEILSTLSSEDPNITGYLLDEVLTHQFPAVQAFLLKTSILDRFCASLCEVVAGETSVPWNARARLDLIERSDLFMISLDNQQEWYRYHHLFQELLQQRLKEEMTPGQVVDLHIRASRWFEGHGLLEEAIQHALAAGDFDLIARQMNAGLREVINLEDRSTLERWLRLLPEEKIQQRPELLMLKVWALQFSWRLELQAQVLRKVEILLDSGRPTSMPVDEQQILRGQILGVKAQQAYFSNQTTQAIEFCRGALALLPPVWTFVRGGAILYLGMSMQASGQPQEAERLMLNEYEACSNKINIDALHVLHSLGFIYLNTGQLEQARRIAQVMLQAASQSNVVIKKNWADWFLGMVHYQQNELDAAAQHFTQIVANPYIAQITTFRDAVAGLTLIHQIKGESSESVEMVESISRFDLELGGSEDGRTRSLRARLELMQGNVEGAGNWADTLTSPPPDMALLWLEEPQVTRARILVARGTDADLQAALQTLESLEDITNRTHNTRQKIEVLALRALALDARGKNSEACAALKQSVDLARPGGFIRVFVDLGGPMQMMLAKLTNQDHSGETIRRILAHFPGEDQKQAGRESSVQHPSLSNLSLPDPLTPRELEILSLLRGPASAKEIADELNLSPATVKRHINNIYAKLGVNKRWKAVARAEELDILPSR